MSFHEAFMLVRQKYFEEQKGISAGPLATRYEKACADYPAIMNIVHTYFTLQLAKDD